VIEVRVTLARAAFALDVALRLPSRGATALFGPSGCGKTTLLRVLAGLERARGRIALGDEVWQDDDRRIWVPTHRRPLGYVIQEAALFPHLSVRGNLDYGLRRAERGSGGSAALTQAVDLLGIGHLMARRPLTLSGGERQRVAIARALAAGPRLLLMDEPLAALDAARKAEILPYLERLQRELAMPIVYVTHAIDEAARLADHLVLLREGRVLRHGPVAELLADETLPLGPQDEAGVVIDAEVVAHEPGHALSRIGFPGGRLWVGETDHAVGQTVRARVLARDVSVTRQRPVETSILNVLPVTLQSLQAGRGTTLLRLTVDAEERSAGVSLATGPDVPLLARITQRSAELLGLQPGDRLYAQVKGVALM